MSRVLKTGRGDEHELFLMRKVARKEDIKYQSSESENITTTYKRSVKNHDYHRIIKIAFRAILKSVE